MPSIRPASPGPCTGPGADHGLVRAAARPPARAWALVATRLDAAERAPELLDPAVLIVGDEADAPGEGFAAAPGHARVDEGVEHAPLTEAQASHDRHGGRRERVRLAADADRPRNAPSEPWLGVLGNRHAGLSCLLAEAVDPRLAGSSLLGSGCALRDLHVGQLTGDEDLLAVTVHGGRRGEPTRPDPPGQPAAELLHRSVVSHDVELLRFDWVITALHSNALVSMFRGGFPCPRVSAGPGPRRAPDRSRRARRVDGRRPVRILHLAG